MAKYNVHAGHCPSGKGASGAVGLLNESDEARKVKNKVLSLLKAEGHTAYDCTCESKQTQAGCLNAIIKKCNKHSVSKDVSIHLNSGRKDKKGDGKTGGVEVLVYSENSASYNDAVRIAREISSALGITNRGVKVRTDLAVLNNNKNKAMLIECCFVDDKDDADRWNVDKCAKAIVKGLLHKELTSKKATKYYNRYYGNDARIDVVFKAIGVPAKYRGSVAARTPVAKANGILLTYKGTATQNLSLINKAKKGTLKKP